MTDVEPFEDRLRASLDHRAEALSAPPVPVSGIVHRSQRRVVRRRAVGALAGVGSLILAAGVVTREVNDVEVRVASGSGSSTTSAPPGSTTSAPGSSMLFPTTSASVSSPTVEVETVPLPGPTPTLPVPDDDPTSLVSSTSRIDVDPGRDLRDGEQVTIRGSRFAPGAQVSFLSCSTDALRATTFSKAAAWCDLTTMVGFLTPDAVTTAGPDGTFAATYTVKGILATAAGAYDCVLATVDPDEAGALRDEGLLGPTSYPEGVWGCSVVAVVTGIEVNADGDRFLSYLDAAAEVVAFGG